MVPSLNPVRLTVLAVGLALARVGLVEPSRVRRIVDLAWPRIVTGLARMSKSAVDIAMVGIAIGPTAIAGLGFASPYWGLTFSLGGGLATGTIALVSQRFGASAFDQLGQAIRTSALLVTAVSVGLAAAMWTFPTALVALLTDDPQSIAYGAAYLRTVSLGVPFAALNLIGSRILIGADDAWSPMILRGGGAVANVGLNALFIFGLGMGVVGAALGTVLANVGVTGAFAVGLLGYRLPGVGRLPVTVSPRGPYVHRETIRDLVRISVPATARRGVWTVARFPMLAFVALFGPQVVAAYVISRRVWGLMNTPGWGFGLATSSLVGQSLGEADESLAERYGHEVAAIAVVTYVIAAGIVFVFAEPIVTLFVDGQAGETVRIAVGLVRAASIAILGRAVGGTYGGALDATGDTSWPFYSRALGMFGLAIPLTYLGATTALGMWGLYLSYFGQSMAPAVINFYRFRTGKWKAISRRYRPESAATND